MKIHEQIKIQLKIEGVLINRTKTDKQEFKIVDIC